jgi:hypothetical protein
MEALSPFHLLIMIAVLGFVIPVQQIIHRTGHSRWWSLLMYVPFVNFIGLWVLAFVRWPAVDKSPSSN